MKNSRYSKMEDGKEVLLAKSGQALIALDQPPEGTTAYVMPTKLGVKKPQEVKQDRMTLKLADHYEVYYLPEEYVQQGVDPVTYHKAKRGVALFCSDIMVTSFLPQGEPVVACVMRKPGGFLGGLWWMQGGVNFPLQNPEDHVATKAWKELGVMPLVEAYMGTWITSGVEENPADDPDSPYASTTGQTCYVGYAPFRYIQAEIGYDPDHVGLRLFRRQDLLINIPVEERNAYPIEAGLLALDSMPPRDHYQEIDEAYNNREN